MPSMNSHLDPFSPEHIERQLDAEARMQQKEEEMGVDPLARLHAEIEALKPRHDALSGRYSDMRVWERKAKSLVLTYALEHRRALRERGEKATDSTIEAMAYSDPRYVKFLEESENDKAEYEWLVVQIQNIREKINRGQAHLRVHASERYAT